VNEAVPGSSNLSPGNVRISLPALFRNALGCFTQDFQKAYECQRKFLIFVEVLSVAVFSELQRFGCGIKHVTQADDIVSS
jgi:hypothetical protein